MTPKAWLAMITLHVESTNWLEDTYPGFTKWGGIERHHLTGIGRSKVAKINLISVNIGHKAVIAIPKNLHSIKSNNTASIAKNKMEFVRRFGLEITIFESQLKSMEQHGFEHDITPELLEAIRRLAGKKEY